MTETVTVMRCALCKKPFSYIPTPEDKCKPGAPNQICDACCAQAVAEAEFDNKLYEFNCDQAES